MSGGKQTQSKEALLKSYNKRLKDDVKSILDNFLVGVSFKSLHIRQLSQLEIVKLGQVEDETQVDRMTHLEEVHLQMSVRSCNMVRAAEALLKLVADVKQYLILNDFPSVNEAITHNSQLFRGRSLDVDQKLTALRDEMAADLYELEEDYYSSIYKDNANTK